MKQKTKKTFGQQLIESLQEFAEALQSGADIEKTFRVTRVEAKPEINGDESVAVTQTRKMLKANQSIFARFVGVSTETLRAWERGHEKPSDIAKRFMFEIRLNPDYWRTRLRDVVGPKKRSAASKSK